MWNDYKWSNELVIILDDNIFLIITENRLRFLFFFDIQYFKKSTPSRS